MTNENGIIEDIETNESELSRMEETEGLGENEQTSNQVDTETQQGNDAILEEETESVSSGDSTYDDTEILESIGILDGRLEALETTITESNKGVFEKELDNYTTSEGLLLVIVLILIATFILERVGNIVRCEKQ